jgi:hypothetical protein
MADMQDHPPIPGGGRQDANRRLEPRVPMNAAHASPATSVLILFGIFAVVFFGAWLFANHGYGRMIAANAAIPAPPLVIAPTPSTTGASPAR